MSKSNQETSLIELDQLDANMLPELNGWKETQLKIVEENPFVKIEDHKSYEDAKKNRTALVTARTTIEKQEKLIASKLKSFRNKVADASKELIAITVPHEEKQQEEVRRYEAIKEAERQEKLRLEQERKDKIQSEINQFYNNLKCEISNLEFLDIENTKEVFNAILEKFDQKDFEEFDMDYAEKKNLLFHFLQEKITDLNEKEEARVEREKLEAERKAFEEQQEEARKKAEQEEAERQKKLEAERKEREAAEGKLRKEREAIEEEKRKIAEAEAKRQAEIEAEEKAKAEAKAKKEAEKRAEALKPDLEKLKSIIASIGIHQEAPELKDKASQTFYTELKLDIEDLKNTLTSKLENLK
ncbi:MAG: hypothetical protein CMC76_12225 [Flavobacteriaceae bacterium]|nr:hypothetical protein [Flavobacteriaceae bacterium]|tara:strand:+ start:4276 stop:5346 length:1071 start_codon:yes stop_codon:yes gene_type:complete